MTAAPLLLLLLGLGLLQTHTDAATTVARPWETTVETTPEWPWETTIKTTPKWPWETTVAPTPEWPWETTIAPSPEWPWETTVETTPDWHRTTTEWPELTTQDKPTPPGLIVSEWPQDMVVKFGSYARIPFTFGSHNKTVPFTAAAIEAVFVGGSELKSIFWAKEGSSGVYEEFQHDFEAIPGRAHDLRINHMTSNLAGEYLARVLSKKLEEEKRQFKVTTTLGEPSCRDSAYPHHVYEGDSVDLDCRLYYAGPSVPTLKWVDCHGKEMAGDYIDEGGNTGRVHHRQYRHSFTAAPKHTHCAFTCHVSFTDDTSYTDDCSTSVLVLSSSPRCNAKHQDTEFGGLLLLDCSSEYLGDTSLRRTWSQSGKYIRGDYLLDETVLPGDKEREAIHRSAYVSMVWDKYRSQLSEFECFAYDPITGQSSNCTLTSHMVRRCHDQPFSEELCPSPSVVEIHGARDYVSADCEVTTCCPRPDTDCSCSLSPGHPGRLSRIKQACNGRQRCEALSLQARRINTCGSLSDYTELYYFCVDPLSK